MDNQINPSRVIEDARRVVAVADEAADDAYRKAMAVIEKRMVKVGTCSHPQKKISAENLRTNSILQKIMDEIAGMIHDDIPF